MIIMLSLFKPKQTKTIIKLLKNHGFYSEYFENYHLQELSVEILYQRLLPALCEVIKDTRMTHFRILKIALLLLRMTQKDKKIVENAEILVLLQFMEGRCQSIIKMQNLNSVSSSRDVIDSSAKNLAQIQAETYNVYSNPVIMVTHKIVLPLIRLEQRLLYCYDLVYRPKERMSVDLGWATLNLLRRFTEFAPTFQQLGRYYIKSYDALVVSMVKVLNYDIKLFYKRVKQFIRGQVNQLHQRLQMIEFIVTVDLKGQMRELLLLIEELLKINQNLLLLYSTKYYCYFLQQNQLLLPALYTNNPETDLFYKLLQIDTKERSGHSRNNTYQNANTKGQKDKQKIQQI